MCLTDTICILVYLCSVKTDLNSLQINKVYLCLIKQRDNSFYRTGYGMVDYTVRVQLQERQRYFSPQRQNRLWHTFEFVFRQQRGPTSGVQQPEYEANHRPPSPMLRMCAANPFPHRLSWFNGHPMY